MFCRLGSELDSRPVAEHWRAFQGGDDLFDFPTLANQMFQDRRAQFHDKFGWELDVDDLGREIDQYDLMNPLYVRLNALFKGRKAGAAVLTELVMVFLIFVPLAGLASWQAWSGSGLAPDALSREALKGPVQGDTLILLGAGVIMVVTLWLSSKARSVTQTEVNLARQDEGTERFRPGPVSRGIVRTAITAGETAMQAVPEQWRTGLAARCSTRCSRLPPNRSGPRSGS